MSYRNVCLSTIILEVLVSILLSWFYPTHGERATTDIYNYLVGGMEA